MCAMTMRVESTQKKEKSVSTLVPEIVQMITPATKSQRKKTARRIIVESFCCCFCDIARDLDIAMTMCQCFLPNEYSISQSQSRPKLRISNLFEGLN